MKGKALVIVESPSKAKTIGKILGSRYKVIASVGHVRDLPKSKLGINIENNFEPEYISIRGKGDVIKMLKKEAKSATVKERLFRGTSHTCWESGRMKSAESNLMRLQRMRSRML